jgi:hypothetical protein
VELIGLYWKNSMLVEVPFIWLSSHVSVH